MDNLIQSDMDDIVMERRIIKQMPGCNPEYINVSNTDNAGALVVARKLRDEHPEARLVLETLTYGNGVQFETIKEALMSQEKGVSSKPGSPKYLSE